MTVCMTVRMTVCMTMRMTIRIPICLAIGAYEYGICIPVYSNSSTLNGETVW